MKFQTEQKETAILNPRNNMEPEIIPSEIRIDPLTGRSARICHFMELKWEKPDFKTMVAGTEKTCPFCPDKVFKITPCFTSDVIPEGRLKKKDMVLFPNIAPYDSLGAVAVLGERHFLSISEISPQTMKDGFLLAMDFFHRVDQMSHPESIYHIINWNYMPPSGSSLIHPHLQVFATSFAPNLMRQELEHAKTYWADQGTSFWDDLVRAEIENEVRYLGKIGRTQWLTSFAPMGVAGDILAVVEDVSSTIQLKETDYLHIAEGLRRVMTGYEKMGIYSFNMNFFTGTRDDSFTRFHLLFSPRTFFNQDLGTPDVGALRNLFNETLCMAFPEDINIKLKSEF